MADIQGLPRNPSTGALLVSAGAVAEHNAAYRTVIDVQGLFLPAALTASTRYFVMALNPVTAGATTAGRGVFHFKNALWTPPTGYVLKLNLTTSMVTNAAAQTATITVRMVPVTASGGASGTVSITAGAAIAASVATIAAPAANQADLYAESGDFAAPADGAYIFSVTNDAALAAAGDMAARVTLLARWVAA